MTAISLPQLGDNLDNCSVKVATEDKHNLRKDLHMNKYVMTAALAMTLGITGIAQADDHKGDKGEKFQRHMMEKIDTNGDGTISKAEFLAAHEEKFTKMDADGNGELSADELKAAREKMKEKGKEFREKMKQDKGAIDVVPPVTE